MDHRRPAWNCSGAICAAAVAVAMWAACHGWQPQPAGAHGLNGSVINRYAALDTYSDLVRLTYALDYDELATKRALPTADTNHDGKYEPAELEAFAESVQLSYLAGLAFELDHDRVPFQPRAASLIVRPDARGFPTVKLTFVYDAPLPRAGSGPLLVGFEDFNFEDNTVWKEIVVRPSSGSAVDIPPGFDRELSRGLDGYPPGAEPPAQDQVAWRWTAGTGVPAPALVPLHLPVESPALDARVPSGGGGGTLSDLRSLLGAHGILAGAAGVAAAAAVLGGLAWMGSRRRRAQ